MTGIDGKTKLACVIGHPLGHTLSPAMHNAVYAHLDLNWAFVPLELPDETALRRFMALAPSLQLVGFSVTMPFKNAVLELCDEVAMAASMAGAVNAVHVVDGKLVGYNTDGRGLLEALQTDVDFTPEGKHIVIIGSGGAAGGAFVALLLARAASVTVVARDATRGEKLLQRMHPHLGGMEARVAALPQSEEWVRRADLIVNATPVGMKPDDPSPLPIAWISPGQVVYDMVYGTALPTALVREAAQVGATAFDGISMLVAQGAIAVDIWNDNAQVRVPRDVMRQAAETELASRRTRG